MLRLIALVVVIGAAISRDVHANIDNPFPDTTVVSPGVKLGYAFGERGGWTYGAELTVLWRTGPDLTAVLAQGPAFNLGWSSRGTFQLRAGWELVSWFAGVEGGPSLVTDHDGTHFGLGVSPWIGAIVVPYYAHTFVPSGTDVTELGTYLKLPLCPGCKSGGESFDFDDLD